MKKFFGLFAIAGVLMVGITGCSVDADAMNDSFRKMGNEIKDNTVKTTRLMGTNYTSYAYEYTFNDGTPVKCLEIGGELQCDFGEPTPK